MRFASVCLFIRLYIIGHVTLTGLVGFSRVQWQSNNEQHSSSNQTQIGHNHFRHFGVV